MKRQNFFARKFQNMIALCFATMILSFPLWAQETNSMEKRYCPYCGMVNLKASKFCGACGTRLPDRMPQPSFQMTSLGHNSLAWTEPNDRPQDAVAGSIVAGLLAGAIGFFSGGHIGAQISDSDGEWDGIYGFIIGASIGEALLLPVGVHLANGRRGNLPLSMLASVGIAGAGIAVAATAGDWKIVIGIPLAQLSACTAIERSTSRAVE